MQLILQQMIIEVLLFAMNNCIAYILGFPSKWESFYFRL